MDAFKKNSFSDGSNLLVDLMEERVIDEKNFQKEYMIDMDYYKKNNMNFNYIASNRFCTKKCYSRRSQFLRDGFLDMKKGGSSEGDKITDPIEHIYLCCGQQNDFIKDEIPLAERIFRVFMKYKNQALNTHKISQELDYYNLYNVFCILSNDTFYGFKEV